MYQFIRISTCIDDNVGFEFDELVKIMINVKDDTLQIMQLSFQVADIIVHRDDIIVDEIVFS